MLLRANSFSTNPIILVPVGIAAFIIILSLINTFRSPPPSAYSHGAPQFSSGGKRPVNWKEVASGSHPIDALVRSSHDEFEKLVQNALPVSTLKEAAAAYRKRRGRHPPPDFRKWFEFAQLKDAYIIEEFFDQIYQDLEPFWSLEPLEMREETLKWPYTFSIRDAQINKRALKFVSGEWMTFWERLLSDIPNLPDVDIAMNSLDESRVIVPWEVMIEHKSRADNTKSLDVPRDRSKIVTSFPNLQPVSLKTQDFGHKGLKEPDGKGPWNQPTPFWDLTKAACPPDSPAQDFLQDKDFSIPPLFPSGFPNGTHHGYISNWTDSKYVCSHPHLANLYGLFVNPRYDSVNTTLVPLFSGCKVLGVNNEIIIPAAKYYSDEEDFDFEGQAIPWESKKDALVWRGQATGGAHKKDNWNRFHRHRFIAMMNSSLVTREEKSQSRLLEDRKQALLAEKKEEKFPPPHNFPVPSSDENIWDLSALKTKPSSLGEWISEKANVGFDHLMCAPWVWSVLGNGKRCAYLDPYFKAQDRIPMGEQFEFKYVPDIDGNSYSGRYRAFLKSTSLPIKSTIWSEWHDSRLVAWKHFVPMDNTFVDFWGIMEYFLGYGSREGESKDPALRKDGHDAVARMIAEEGHEWAEKVLRKEDMLVYTYRLLLEYKRVTSDERLKMMWVEDLP